MKKQDHKNMEAIIKLVFAYKPRKRMIAPKNKPPKKMMEQKYKYMEGSNTFIEVD